MIYRQRFSLSGWCGAAMFALGPTVTGALLGMYFSEPSYDRPHYYLIVLASLLTPIGATMMLIGREYYDAASEIQAEKEARERETRALREERGLTDDEKPN